MNNFLKDLAAQRQKFLDGLDANKGDINLDIFEDFYPDQAHFLLELLQNAEDVEATEATFEIYQHGCSFTHNGKRTFNTDDVRAITGIHNSTKIKAVDQIGKFGVGFKAVFVYTLSPEIFSGEFAFRILRLVFPKEVSGDRCLGADTRFWLPFDNPRKVAAAAFTEIRDNLSTLSDTTLLFLSHLELIGWQVDGAAPGEIMRVQHSDNHFEVRRQVGGETATSSHFLKFDQPVVGLEKQRIAVAFALDALPNVQSFDPTKPLAKQFRITSANPGRVAVYFSAEKETSGLRFHLHAPFVPELSRASIKETPANQPLFEQLAALTVTALPQIRDLGLLTTDFLAVLPNPQDAVPPRYEPIRNAIVEAMNTELLTPTHARSHEPANRLLQAPASLKDLLSAEDLEFLVDHDGAPPLWAIAAPQKNSNADRFLEGLSIRKWDTEQFVDLLSEKNSDKCRYSSHLSKSSYGPDEDFMAWLAAKPVEWHQKLYALLNENLASLGWRKDGLRKKLQKTKLMRLADGQYSTGSNCFFPSDDGKDDDGLPRVDKGVYTSGRSKQQQENARKFLEEMGVREVGEAERVEAILKQRYTAEAESPDKKTYLRDLKRFVALVEKEPNCATLFKDYHIFECEPGQWCQPSQVYLDEPFLETGLRAYYQRQEDDAELFALGRWYQSCGVPEKKIAAFAKVVGARAELPISKCSCNSNPEWDYLRNVGGERNASPLDIDYTIPELAKLLKTPSLGLSKLVWRTMCALPAEGRYLDATYRRNLSAGSRQADSTLVHVLRNAAWVPQGKNLFVRPAEASRDPLPDGFAFDPGQRWLKAIQFGAEVIKRSEEHRQKQVVAEELGFADQETLDHAQRFAALPKDVRERVLVAHERPQSEELPDDERANPQRRAQRVQDEAKSAPLKDSELRTRSVSMDIDAVKARAEPYLRDQYTNADHETLCQICKSVLPFKLDNGAYYFEKVQFLAELTKRHHQNYLALCPNHAAMFQHANGSRDSLMEIFIDLADNRLPVVLAQQETTIYFTKTHIADLKAVIESEKEAAGEAAETD